MKLLVARRHLKGGFRRQQLLQYLEKYAELNIVDIELTPINKIINYIFCFHVRKSLWRERLRKNAYYFHSMSFQVKKVLDAHRKQYDAVLFFEGLFGPGTYTGPCIPYAIYEDTTAMVCRREWQPWAPDTMNSQKYLFFEKNLYRNALVNFGAVEKTKESFINDYHVDSSKVYNVGMGCNLPLNQSDEKENIRPYFLFVGYETERKGLNTLINAFKKLRTRNPEVLLKLVGPEIDVDDDHIIVTGQIKSRGEMIQLYDHAMAFIMPSIFDPVPSAVLEALGRGVPTIVSDGCGGAEFIQLGGNGFVFKKSNEDDLVKYLDIILKNKKLRQSMRKKAYETGLNNFDWDLIAGKMIQIIEEKLNHD